MTPLALRQISRPLARLLVRRWQGEALRGTDVHLHTLNAAANRGYIRQLRRRGHKIILTKKGERIAQALYELGEH